MILIDKTGTVEVPNFADYSTRERDLLAKFTAREIQGLLFVLWLLSTGRIKH